MLKRSTLFITGLALGLTCFGQTESGSKQFSHVKLIEDFVHAPESKPGAPFTLTQGFGTNLRGATPMRYVRGPRSLTLKEMEARRIRIARALAGPRCGHIIVKSAPAGIDSKSLREFPKRDEAMPVIKGLPACAEDMR